MRNLFCSIIFKAKFLLKMKMLSYLLIQFYLSVVRNWTLLDSPLVIIIYILIVSYKANGMLISLFQISAINSQAEFLSSLYYGVCTGK